MIAKVLVYVIFVLVLIFGGYFIYTQIYELNAPPISFIQRTVNNENQSSYSDNLQFNPNMRFSSSEISYNIEDSCDEQKKIRVVEALDFIETKVGIINFFYSQENPGISVKCDENKYKESSGKYLIAGEGGPEFFYNGGFSIIENGTIFLFYKKSFCNTYNVELHELLHVFGFEHSSNPNSLMYPTLACYQAVTNDIIQELVRLYSIAEKPDLFFDNVTATKHGSYLDFKVEIGNKGLTTGTNIRLEVYSGSEKFYTYQFEDIKNNEARSLSGSNIKIGKNIGQIEFVIVAGEELNTNNNNVSLYLTS